MTTTEPKSIPAMRIFEACLRNSPCLQVSPYEAMRDELATLIDHMQPYQDEVERLEREDAYTTRDHLGYAVRAVKDWMKNLDAGMELLAAAPPTERELSREERQSLQKVLDYLWPAEHSAFCSLPEGDDTGHVFNDLLRLSGYLSRTESPCAVRVVDEQREGTDNADG